MKKNLFYISLLVSIGFVFSVYAGDVTPLPPGPITRPPTLLKTPVLSPGAVSPSHPVPHESYKEWLQVSAGGYMTLAIAGDHTLWWWGSKCYEEYGQPIYDQKLFPTKVGHDANWEYVSSGADHVCAVKFNGTLWCWGHNDDYEVGDGTREERVFPIQVGTDTDWIYLSLGHGTIHSVLNSCVLASFLRKQESR